MKITRNFYIIIVLLFLASCTKTEEIPIRPDILKKDTSKIQKSVMYKKSSIFLQSRLHGIRTNDLIIENENSELRYLSDNKFFIQDFCITSDGTLYYIEAGQDIGYEPLAGVRSSKFSIKYIDLNSGNYEINNFLPGKYYSRPKNLELDSEGNLLCFATDFGEVHIIDRISKKEINILPQNIDTEDVFGHNLSADRNSFIVSIKMGVDANNNFIWKKHKIDLKTKILTEVQNTSANQ